MRFDTQEEIEQWLMKSLSEHADIPLVEIQPTMSFAAFGVDSVESVELATELDDAFEGFTVKPDLFWEVDSIRELAQELFAKSSTLAGR